MVSIAGCSNLIEIQHRLQRIVYTNFALVDLSANRINQLYDIFPAWFSNISILKLNNCKCRGLKRDTFRNFHNIEYIYMDDNELKSLAIGLFDNCPRLQKLSFRNNSFVLFPRNTFTRMPSLKELDFSRNQLGSLQLVESDSLEVLNLSDNLIEVFARNRLQNLIFLDLSRNRLQTVNGIMLRNMPNLIELNLNNNEIDRLPKNCFQYSMSLETLRLNNNRIVKFVTGLFFESCLLKVLELDNNGLQDFIVSNDHGKLCESLSIAYNSLVKTNFFQQLKCLKRLVLSGCSFRDFNVPSLAMCTALSYLDLKHCQIKIPVDYFWLLANLKHLTIDYCCFANAGSFDEPLFRGVNTLEYLSMRFCGVVSIGPAFRFLRRLTHLNLANNEIAVVHENAFESLDALKFLNLRANRLQRLPANVFRNLVQVEKIDLCENPLIELKQESVSFCVRLKKLDFDHGTMLMTENLRRETV